MFEGWNNWEPLGCCPVPSPIRSKHVILPHPPRSLLEATGPRIWNRLGTRRRKQDLLSAGEAALKTTGILSKQPSHIHFIPTHPPPPILNLVCFFVWKKKCFFVSSLLNPLWSPSLWSRHSGLYLCCFLVGFWVEENLDNHIGTFRNEQAVDSVNTPWATWSGQGLASGLHLPRICLEAGSGSCSLLQRAH